MKVPASSPKYLNITKIRLPIAGVVSIAHRISGVLMFIAIPLMVYLLHRSVSGYESFLQVRSLLQLAVVKFAMLPLFWSVYHHLFAGIRFIMIDLDVGVDKPASRISAIVVFIAALLAALLTLVALL